MKMFSIEFDVWKAYRKLISQQDGADDIGSVGIQLMEIDRVLMVRDLEPGGVAERCYF
jgi:hypothetical protein